MLQLSHNIADALDVGGQDKTFSRMTSNLCFCLLMVNLITTFYHKGPFKYYVIKEVGGWGQKMAIFDDLQYCKSSKKWVGAPKKVKNMMT